MTMLKKISLIVFGLFLGLSALILIRTYQFSQPIAGKPAQKIPPIPDSALSHLQQAIRIKTIGFGDGMPVDTLQYLRFWTLIEKIIPNCISL